MRLLLTGSSGQIGWELRRRLTPAAELIALDRSQLDFSEPRRIADIVRGIGPDVIVNAAAYTAVDNAEDEEALAMTINGTAVGVLAEEARRSGALLLHYSTDYVFDGSKHAPYIEDDPPHPINSYGRSKLAGDTAIRQIGGAYLILRTSWVYAARRHNFLRTMLRLAGEKDELRIVADQCGAPTWAHDIADATARILSQAVAERADGAFAPGVFHLTSSGSTTWHGFARVILDGAARLSLLPRMPGLRAIATADYPTRATRPRNSRLSGERLAERFGIALPDWRQSVASCLQEIKQQDQAGSPAA
jgi:dTDP-4-dehydrorhamnose reductase